MIDASVASLCGRKPGKVWVSKIPARIVLGLLAFLVSTWVSSEPRLLRVNDVFDIKSVVSPVINPAGTGVVFAVVDFEKSDLFFVPLAGGEAVPLLTIEARVKDLAWFSDGKSLAFLLDVGLGESEVALLLLSGEPTFQLAGVSGSILSFEFSPDGQRMAMLVRGSANSEREGLASVGTEKSHSGERISVDFEDSDWSEVLALFEEISGLTFILDPDVRGKVNHRAKDVEWDRLFEEIVGSNDVDFMVYGSTVRVGYDLEDDLDHVPVIIRESEFKREGEGYIADRPVHARTLPR